MKTLIAVIQDIRSVLHELFLKIRVAVRIVGFSLLLQAYKGHQYESNYDKDGANYD